MATVRDHLISSGHHLSLQVSGHVRAVRDAGGYHSVGGGITLYFGELAVFHLGYLTARDEFLYYDESADADVYSHYVDWAVSYNKYGDVQTLDGGSRYIGNWLSYYGWPPGGNPPSYNEEFPFSVTVEGDFELRCRFGVLNHGQWPFIWKAYTVDSDPYGPTPDAFEYYYVPEGDLTVTISYCGEEAVVLYIDTEGMESTLRKGLGSVKTYLDGKVVYQGVDTAFDADDLQLVAQASVSGIGGNYPEMDVDLPNPGGGICAKGTLLGMTGKLYDTGISERALTWNLWYGPYTLDIRGYLLHLDGTPVQYARVEYSEEIYDISDSAGYVHITHDFEGCYDFGWPSEYGEDIGYFKRDGGDVETGYAIHYAPIIVDDNLTLGEPFFPWCGNDPGGSEDWNGFWDRRIEFITPQFSWPNAFKVQPSAMSKDVLSFDDASGWTVTPTGAAVVTLDAGKVKVEVTNDCSVSKSFAGSNHWRGARYARLIYTSNDTDPISMTVDSREYDVVNATTNIDLLAMKGDPGTDLTQTAFPDNTPGWGWGIADPGTIEIGDLKAGKTYTFEKVTLKKLPANEGGTIEVLATDGAFVGDRPGHSREGDEYSMFFYKENPLDEEELPHYASRKAIVFFDGMPAAEVFDHIHYKIGGIEDTWVHYKLPLSDSRSLFPTDGMAELIAGTPIAGQTDWQNGDIEVTFMKSYQYVNASNSDYCNLHYKSRTCVIAVPFAMNFPVLEFGNRYVRGRGWVRAFKSDGTPASNKPVTISTRRITGGSVFESISGLTTDSKGILRMPALKQPQLYKTTIAGVYGPTTYMLYGLNGWIPIGHKVYFWGAVNSKPNERTIVDYDGELFSVILDSAPVDDDRPAFGQPMYILLEYPHEVDVEGLGSTEVTFRNHGWSMAFLRLGTEIHGPVYNPLDGTTRPCYLPDDATDRPEYI